MKLFFKKLLKYFFIIYITASLVALGLDYSLTHSRFYKSYLNAHNEEHLKDVDMLIFGGSRAMAGLNAEELGKALGLKVYNVGFDDTGIGSHLLLLKVLWKRGIHPKYIVLEYMNFSNKHHWGWSTNDLRFMPMILTDPDVSSYVKENKGAAFAYANMAMPFFKYSYFNEELFFPALTTIAKKTTRYRSDAYGDYSYPASSLEKDNKSTAIKVDTLNTAYCDDYKEFIQFCADKGIKVKTLVAPIEREHAYTTDTTILNYTYLDLPDKYYYDKLHINADGKEKVEEQLAKDLREQFLSTSTQK